MEKVYSLKRFVFLVMILGLMPVFTSCDDENDPKPNAPELTDVVGDYTGKMQILTINPREDEAEEPQGTDVTAEVTNENVVFEKFPVADLIKTVIGDEEAAAGIIEAIGDVNYQVKYTPAFNDDKTAISMTLAPEPLVLEINFPTSETAEGEGEGGGEEEAPDMTVEVTVTADAAGSFAYADSKLAFKLGIAGVKVNGESFEGLRATTFSFDLSGAE